MMIAKIDMIRQISGEKWAPEQPKHKIFRKVSTLNTVPSENDARKMTTSCKQNDNRSNIFQGSSWEFIDDQCMIVATSSREKIA